MDNGAVTGMSKTRRNKALAHVARVGLVLAATLLSAEHASAQSAADRVNQMSAEAMEAYNNLDIDRAGQLLVQAIEFANQNGVSGPAAARANMNLGVVYVGGVADNQNGLVYFLAAVCADPSIQLDPLTSTPDIQSVFQLAQQRAQGGGCSGGGTPAPGPAPGPQPMPGDPGLPMPGPAPSAMGELIHTPPTEQRHQTPLPLYAEVSVPNVKSVHLYYRGLGMEAFKRVEMVPFGAGYAYQLSCQDVWEPRVSYYIAVIGDGGQTLAGMGSAQAPIEVAVIGTSPSIQPSLPDTQPPPTCEISECPPGLSCPEPRGTSAMGEPCERTNDCQGGLACSDDVCVLLGAGEQEPDDDGPASTDFAPFFVQIGGALGFAHVQAGMTADRGPTPGRPDTDVFQNRSPWVADGNSVFSDGTTPTAKECPAAGVETTYPEPPDTYCVSVPAPGLVLNTAVRAAIGYFVAPWLSLAAVLRYQPDHGEATLLPGMLVGGRAEIMLTSPEAMGLSASLMLGSTFGTIMIKPPAKDPQWDKESPYIISGNNGAQIGSTIRYRFARNFGVFVAPEMMAQFPLFLFNFDLSAGVELAL